LREVRRDTWRRRQWGTVHLLRERLTVRISLRAKAGICDRFRLDNSHGVDPPKAAKRALRSVARRIVALDEEVAELDVEIERLVKLSAPNTTNELCIGTIHAATLLVAAGENIDRLHNEAAFAHLCGVTPIKASSGRTNRHRLNYGGNRQANRALHLIVIVRLRYCPKTRAYMTRRLAEGLTKKEVIRCLKRYIIREIHRNLRADLATLNKRLDALWERQPGRTRQHHQRGR